LNGDRVRQQPFAFSGLNKDEIDAIKEHEHIPEIAAAAWQTIY
jgi:hypothetical protein